MINIYTDGACKGNPGPGGWGALIIENGEKNEIFGGEANTTNNRMEIMAVIMALRSIEKKCEMQIPQIFKKRGEDFFRAEEVKEVLKCLKETNSVIALGGGAFINKAIRDNILKNSISIWLDVKLKDLSKRLKWSNKRPLLNKDNKQKEINKLFHKRKNIYKLANYKINCDNLNKKNIAEKIITLYEKY